MIKYSCTFRVSLVLLTFCFAPALSAEELILAKFKEKKVMFASQFACKSIPQDLLDGVVYCSAYVNPEGETVGTSIECKSLSEDSEFTNITVDNLRDYKFEPAQVNGRAVSVKLLIRVLYRHSAGSCTAVSVLNNGHKFEQYGAKYVAPQEVVEEGDILRDYSTRLHRAFANHDIGNIHDSYIDAVTLLISEEGANVKTVFEPRNAKLSLKRLMRSSLKGRSFIPGESNGTRLEMELLMPTGGSSILRVSDYGSEIILLKND